MDTLATSLDDLRQQQLLLERQIEIECHQQQSAENYDAVGAADRAHELEAMRGIRERYQYHPAGLNASTDYSLPVAAQEVGRKSGFFQPGSASGKPPRRATSAIPSSYSIPSSQAFADPTNMGVGQAHKAAAITSAADRTTVLKQLQASRMQALNNYFNAMTNYPNYEERRKTMMAEGLVKPFAFVQREAAKPKSHRQRRLEEDRNEKALAEVAAYENGCFKAHAVPPSTFLNKYELMVQEWCARKEAIRAIAEDKATKMKEEEAVLYRYANSFKEAKAKASRARSVEIDSRFKQFKAKDVPADIKDRKWPSFAEQEADRQRRIRARAEALLAVSHRPPRMESAHREAMEQDLRPKGFMPSAAGSGATFTPGTELNLDQNNLIGITSAVGGAQTGMPTTSFAVGDCCPDFAHGTSGVCLCECHKRTAHAREVAEAQRLLSQHNPNFTFQPNLRTDVPDFEYLWAKDRLEMAKRKSHKPPTQPQTFNLTVTRDSKEKIIREVEADRARREADVMAKTLLPMGRVMVAPRASSASRLHALQHGGTNRLVVDEITGQEDLPQGLLSRDQYERAYNEALARTYKTTDDGTITFEPKAPRPAGTRAHMMKCEAAYQRLDSKRREEEIRGAEEAVVRQRQTAINKKVQQYLPPSQKRDNERKIEQKRRQFEEQSVEANRRLTEMKRSIANRPPIFVEPYGVTDMIKAKATTEEEVMRLLRETGLDQRTLAAVSSYPAALAVGKDAGAHSPLEGGKTPSMEIVHAVDVEHKVTTTAKKGGSRSSSSSSSNSSRSSKSSRSSRSTRSAASRKASTSSLAEKKGSAPPAAAKRSPSSSSSSSRSSSAKSN